MRVNQDLANNLGNLLNRTVSMILKYFDGVIPAWQGDLTDLDEELSALVGKTKIAYESYNDDLKVSEAYVEVMNLVSRANKYIEETAPWALAKDPGKKKELESVMAHLAHVLYSAGMMMKPVLVHKSDAIFASLGCQEEDKQYENISRLGFLGGRKVVKGEQLFPRLDAEKEIQAIADMMAAPKEKAAA